MKHQTFLDLGSNSVHNMSITYLQTSNWTLKVYTDHDSQDCIHWVFNSLGRRHTNVRMCD
jgi:hypothetical protein